MLGIMDDAVAFDFDNAAAMRLEEYEQENAQIIAKNAAIEAAIACWGGKSE